MGGPAHGTITEFPGDPPHMMTVPAFRGKYWDDTFYPYVAVYKRQVSSLDTGPIWVFVYDHEIGIDLE